MLIVSQDKQTIVNTDNVTHYECVPYHEGGYTIYANTANETPIKLARYDDYDDAQTEMARITGGLATGFISIVMSANKRKGDK